MRDPKAIANAVNTPELGIQKQVITPAQRVLLLDVSELYRPESKKIDEFRVYNADIIAENRIMARVYETYLQMHTYQTLDFVKGQVILNYSLQSERVNELLQIFGNICLWETTLNPSIKKSDRFWDKDKYDWF